MRLTEISYDLAKPIDGYGPGFFRIDGKVLTGPCLITPWGASTWAVLPSARVMVLRSSHTMSLVNKAICSALRAMPGVS